MGGLNETRVGGMRIHENAGQVHLHDDKAGLKVEVPKADFKSEWDALKAELGTNPAAERVIRDAKRGTAARLRGSKDAAGKSDVSVTIEKAVTAGAGLAALDIFAGSL